MTATGRDAIVIGGGIGGLVAASYLARAGLRVLLAERRPFLGGLCAARTTAENGAGVQSDLIYALDRNVVEEFALARRGLRFEVRDLPLVGLRAGGRHIVLGRNPHAAAFFIRPHSERDARAYARFRRLQFSQARAARRLWWDSGSAKSASAAVRRLSFLSAAALLDSWFESDALKAVLAFDATADGVSVDEPPSALTLLWRAAQENAGLQSANGVLRGGSPSLVVALADAAGNAGVEIRTSTSVRRLRVRDSEVVGVALESGEEIDTPLVMSSLARARSYDLLPTAETGIGVNLQNGPHEVAAAKIWLSLDGVPPGASVLSEASRFIVVERLEQYFAAHEASRNGQMPSEIIFETVSMPANGGTELSILVRPLPRWIAGGWKDAAVILVAKVVASLGKFDRGIKDRIRHIRITTPEDLEDSDGATATPPSVDRLLARAEARVETSISGFFICGADTEPVTSISGRSARKAAGLAIAAHRAKGGGSRS